MMRLLINIALAAAIAAGIAMVATRGDIGRVGEAVTAAANRVVTTKAERVERRDAAKSEQEAANAEALAALRQGAGPKLEAAERLAKEFARLAPSDTPEAAAAGAMLEQLAALKAAVAEAEGEETPESADSVAEVPFPVVVRDSRADAFDARLELSGRLEANRRVEVRAQTGGVVESSPLDRGDVARQGDLLCRIAMGDRAARKAEAEARLRQAASQAQTQNALRQRGFTSQTAAVDAAVNQDVARAQIAQLQVDIENTTLRAPFTGLIEQGPAEEGSLLQVGGLCATLASVDPIKIVAFAPEREVGRFDLGAPAKAVLLNGRELTGRVTYIASAADSATRTFEIEASFSNPDRALREGMSAELTLDLPPRQGHLLPQSALTLNETGRIGVRTAEAGVARFKPVEILRDSAEGVWVRGLGAAAQVIVVGQEYVSEGAPIEARLETAAEPSQ